MGRGRSTADTIAVRDETGNPPPRPGDAARDDGVVVNPPKAAQLTFRAEDRVIVLAED